jgi:hypothetical protein
MPLLGIGRAVEVKCRAAGFAQLYDWLNERDVLIVKSDRQEPLVVVRLSLAAEIAKATASDVPNRQHGQDRAGPLRDSLEDVGAAK